MSQRYQKTEGHQVYIHTLGTPSARHALSGRERVEWGEEVEYVSFSLSRLFRVLFDLFLSPISLLVRIFTCCRHTFHYRSASPVFAIMLADAVVFAPAVLFGREDARGATPTEALLPFVVYSVAKVCMALDVAMSAPAGSSLSLSDRLSAALEPYRAREVSMEGLRQCLAQMDMHKDAAQVILMQARHLNDHQRLSLSRHLQRQKMVVNEHHRTQLRLLQVQLPSCVQGPSQIDLCPRSSKELRARRTPIRPIEWLSKFSPPPMLPKADRMDGQPPHLSIGRLRFSVMYEAECALNMWTARGVAAQLIAGTYGKDWTFNPKQKRKSCARFLHDSRLSLLSWAVALSVALLPVLGREFFHLGDAVPPLRSAADIYVVIVFCVVVFRTAIPLVYLPLACCELLFLKYHALRGCLALLDEQRARQLYLPYFPVADADVPFTVRMQLLAHWLSIRNNAVIPYARTLITKLKFTVYLVAGGGLLLGLLLLSQILLGTIDNDVFTLVATFLFGVSVVLTAVFLIIGALLNSARGQHTHAIRQLLDQTAIQEYLHESNTPPSLLLEGMTTSASICLPRRRHSQVAADEEEAPLHAIGRWIAEDDELVPFTPGDTGVSEGSTGSLGPAGKTGRRRGKLVPVGERKAAGARKKKPTHDGDHKAEAAHDPHAPGGGDEAGTAVADEVGEFVAPAEADAGDADAGGGEEDPEEAAVGGAVAGAAALAGGGDDGGGGAEGDAVLQAELGPERTSARPLLMMLQRVVGTLEKEPPLVTLAELPVTPTLLAKLVTIAVPIFSFIIAKLE